MLVARIWTTVNVVGRDAFELAARAGDLDALTSALAPDVAFRGPAFPDATVGRERVGAILAAAFGGVYEDFEYVDALSGAARTVLLFNARVGDHQMEGAQVLGFNADDLVNELVVMVRPAAAAAALGQAILAALGIRSPNEV